MKGIILNQYYGYDSEAIFGVPIPKSRLLRQCFKYALFPFSFYVKNLYYKIPRNVSQGKMLDVGCGSGGYIMMLRKLNWEVSGQDISGVALDRIKKDPMTHVLAGELSDQCLPENYFDLVTLWHSLEHMRDPMAVLKEVYRATKAGGNVFICVPNFSGIFRRVFKSQWFPLELPRHLYHFSPPILNKMVSRAGFKPGVTRYIPLRSLLPMSIRYMLAEKQKDTSIAESKMLLRACTWVQRLSAFFHQSDVILLQVTKK
jgi:SAM-dependent methyltransferase